MELIRGRHNLRPAHRGCVATVGNFDGVHRGHAALLSEVTRRARALGVPATVVTFEPQPLEHFAPGKAPARLTSLREKLAALATLGVDRVLVLRFDDRLASLAPSAFVDELIVDGLGVRELVIGDDFRFGKGGAGDFALLARAGEAADFAVLRQETFASDGERVSSSRIRDALAVGELAVAAGMLGRPYALRGRVVRGEAIGASIGFATANFLPRRQACPVSGVFAARVDGLPEGPRRGVANVGSRPTVGGTGVRLEVHIFGMDRALYGEHLEVELVEKLRGERRFESLEALKAQLARDVAAARSALACNG